MLRTGLNILWILLGGWLNFLTWTIAGLLFAVTIVGLPWARAAFTMAIFSSWPFGKEAVDRAALNGQPDIGTGAFGLIGNILWFVFAGWWIALGNIAAAILLACTIIGIPLAVQCIKIAGLSIAPIGKTVVDNEVYAEIRKRRAAEKLGAVQA